MPKQPTPSKRSKILQAIGVRKQVKYRSINSIRLFDYQYAPRKEDTPIGQAKRNGVIEPIASLPYLPLQEIRFLKIAGSTLLSVLAAQTPLPLHSYSIVFQSARDHLQKRDLNAHRSGGNALQPLS